MTPTPAPIGDTPSEANMSSLEYRAGWNAAMDLMTKAIYRSAALTPPPAAQAEPSEAAEIRFIYVDESAVSPRSIVEARDEGDLSPDEAIEWIEKLIRHNMKAAS